MIDRVRLRKIQYMRERYDLPYWIIAGFLEIHNYDMSAALEDIRNHCRIGGDTVSKEHRLEEEAQLRKYIAEHKPKS